LTVDFIKKIRERYLGKIIKVILNNGLVYKGVLESTVDEPKVICLYLFDENDNITDIGYFDLNNIVSIIIPIHN
jgi:hypothetical protein